DVAEGPRSFPDALGHSLVALGALTDGPVDRGSDADPLLPLGTHFGQIIHPDVSGAASVGAVDHADVLVRQDDVGIQISDRVIVPLLDLAKEYVGQQRAGEGEWLGGAFEIIGWHNGAHSERDVEDFAARVARFLELFVVHGTVAGTEVRSLGRHLLDAAAGADGLIVDFDPLGLVVLGCPLAHHRVNERGAGAVDAWLATAATQQTNQAHPQHQQTGGFQDTIHDSHPFWTRRGPLTRARLLLARLLRLLRARLRLGRAQLRYRLGKRRIGEWFVKII